MRVVVAWLLLLGPLAGCLVEDDAPDDGKAQGGTDAAPAMGSSGSSTTSQPQPPEPDTLFVHVSRSFGFNRTSGSGGLSWYGGHHCGGASWTPDPLTVTLHEWRPQHSTTGGPSATGHGPWTGSSHTTTSGPEPDHWSPTGLLLTSWDQTNITNKTYSFIGHGATVAGFDADAGSAAIASVFGSRIVANLTSQDGQVRIDGGLLQPGVPYVVRAAYTVTTTNGGEPGTFAIEERLAFTLRGTALVTNRVMGNYCI